MSTPSTIYRHNYSVAVSRQAIIRRLCRLPSQLFGRRLMTINRAPPTVYRLPSQLFGRRLTTTINRTPCSPSTVYHHNYSVAQSCSKQLFAVYAVYRLPLQLFGRRLTTTFNPTPCKPSTVYHHNDSVAVSQQTIIRRPYRLPLPRTKLFQPSTLWAPIAGRMLTS